jgi:hypothetical protein
MTDVEEEIIENVIKKYTRAIVHMRDENRFSRFGLILGAGFSRQFGFPKWDDLINEIAHNPSVNATDLIGKPGSNTSKSQLIFQKYRFKMVKDAKDEDHLYNKLELGVKASWHKIVNDVLYKNVPEEIDDLVSKDKYIKNYIKLMKNKITITYNFDDSLEKILNYYLDPEERNKTKGYKTIWDENIPLVPETSIVYHPNGFLPRNLTQNPSPELIILEDSFEDQLMDGMSGHYTFLVNHLARTTCLFLGLSLDDPSLKHLLRQNALRNPGQYHYYIQHIDDETVLNDSYRQSFFDSLFDVYNLITLYLDDKEKAALGYLLTLDDKEFQRLLDKLGLKNVYKYYIAGSVCVGKSTIVSHFKNLNTIEEWLDIFPEGMEKDPSKAQERLKIIDEWIAKQWYRKNIIINECNCGILIIDRTPLDAFAFTDEDKWADKAILTKQEISPGRSNYILSPGHIILLIGDPKVMGVRAIICHRDTDADHLLKQQEMLIKVYSSINHGVTRVDTTNRNISQVIKEVARIIHCSDYQEAPMQEWLDKQIKRGS